MNKYEIRTNEKKNAIIKVSLKLFGEKGYSKVAIKEIAKLAQVSQVSIYNYFESKENLMKVCINSFMDDLIEESMKILSLEITFEEKVKTATNKCNLGINSYIMRFFTDEALKDKTLFDMLHEHTNDKMSHLYLEFIRLGKKDQIIRDDIDEMTILSFIRAVNNINPDDFTVESLVDYQKKLQHLILYGIIGTSKTEL